MKKIDIDLISENFARMIPLFGQKIVEPFDQNIKKMLSPLIVHTLFIISRNEFITMAKLAEELRILRPQLTPIVDKLIKLNYVSRETDSDDRRVIKIKITKEGMDFVKHIHENAVVNARQKLVQLSDEELLDLEDGLEKLYKIIDKL